MSILFEKFHMQVLTRSHIKVDDCSIVRYLIIHFLKVIIGSSCKIVPSIFSTGRSYPDRAHGVVGPPYRFSRNTLPAKGGFLQKH